MKFWFTALLTFALITQSSFAYESDDGYGYQNINELQAFEYNVNQGDATRIEKFEIALDTLGIPHEKAPDFSNFVHAGEVNVNEMKANLPFIDPDLGLSRYLSIFKGNLQLFRDFYKSMISLDYLEYQQTLTTQNPSNDSSTLMQRLQTVATQTQLNQLYPLQGLKVLIDPGHMGGTNWDQFTGKYVSVNGTKVSEGALNLWTSFLVAKKLEKLGATVKLTRDYLGSVSSENPNTFDTTPFINSYFHNSMDGWMSSYLNLPIDQLKRSIKNASEVQKAYTPAQRAQYFITGLDLEARSLMIDQFNPDITLDIHFDASDTGKLQNVNQSLEAFIPGSFRSSETGGRKSKMMALKHLLEVRRWGQSVELADHVTQSMSTALKIPRLSVPEAFTAKKVRDGVYARNLYIARRAFSSLVIYLECMHYDHVKEHSRLAIKNRSGTYRNISFKYPSRLDTLSTSIENGFLSYFKNMKQF